jgi:hypothetical protein
MSQLTHEKWYVNFRKFLKIVSGKKCSSFSNSDDEERAPWENSVA